MTIAATKELDRYYAHCLGCGPEDLNCGCLMVVGNPRIGTIMWAKAAPLVVLAFGKGESTVISVTPGLKPRIEAALRHTSQRQLNDEFCDLIEDTVLLQAPSAACFRGIRLYCDLTTFNDKSTSSDLIVTTGDAHGTELNQMWGGEVFGHLEDGQVVSWAAIKPLSEIAWDIRAETLPEYRGRGCATGAVSAAAKHILSRGKIAAWACDRTNEVSIRTARSVGFQQYALEFGCVAED